MKRALENLFALLYEKTGYPEDLLMEAFLRYQDECHTDGEAVDLLCFISMALEHDLDIIEVSC